MKRVLIASPLRQKLDILEEFLSNLTRLKVPDDVYLEHYYLINKCDEAIPLVEKYGHSYDVADVDNTCYRSPKGEHVWDKDSLTSITFLRNTCLKYAIKHNFDYIWFIDTDIIVHPDTLAHLLSLKVPLVAEIMWTNSEIGIWCNANPYCYHMLNKAENDMYQLIDEYQHPGLYKTGYTGANFLINREIWEAGIDYNPIPNMFDANYGEDRSFCCKALARGYEVLLDTYYPGVHLYNDEKLKSYLEHKEAILQQMTAAPSRPIML